MEALVGILGASLVASVGYLIAWATRNDTARVLRESAGRAGVTDVKSRTNLGLEQAVTGSLDGFRVELGSYDVGGGVRGTRIVVRGMGHGPFGLTIRPESLGKAFERVFDGGEIELGDPAFDAVAYVQGDPSIARAVLGIPARKGLSELLRGRFRVPGPGGEEALEVSAFLAGDALTVDVPREAKAGAVWIPAALGSLAALARDLALSGDVATRIAASLPSEEPAGVRLGHVRLLAREFPDLPVTREALRAACRDAEARVRLVAAEALGEEGREALLGVATSEDAREEDAVRAVEALGRSFPHAEAARLLASALGTGRTRLARACADALGRAEGAPGPETAAVLERALLSPVPEVAAAAAKSIASAGFTSSELALVGALGHAAAGVRIAAAEALGRVGTPVAVVPLQECGSANALDLALRRATRQAIGEIQSRVPGASPGQLSLVSETAGQLSLAAEEEAGRLSLDARRDAEG